MNPAEPREESVFEAALQLPAEQRAAYLDQTCAGDPQMRQRIEALLGAFDRAGGFMSQPAAAGQTVASSPPSSAEKPGARIGRYKLLQQIGEGGCGVVYMAEQEEPVRRRVALKVIKLGMDTKQVIARFEAERQALALMDHPNIARVLDAGATDTGRPYFVMELVRGVRITDFCDEHQLSPEQRLRLFIQVCQAIQHAHQKGVIHRDVKPSNILVSLNDGVPVPKVIDFGIAKATQGRLTDQTLFTAFEQFIGTPAYMSPEQAVMTSLDIDTRTDIYSLGVLLYELLTGRTPFDAKELLAAGFDEMRRTIREQDPPRPSTRLDTLAADVLTTTARHRHIEAPRLIHLLRGDLDWIVMKCLEKDRSRRYETANGLARDIERHLATEPVVARPPSTLYRFQKAVRRHRAAFAAATAIFVVLVAGITVSVSQTIRAERKERKSQEVARFLKDMLQGVQPSVALGRDTTVLKDILNQTADRVGRDLGDLPEVEAELRGTIGNVYHLISEDTRAVAMYQRALDLRRSLPGNQQAEIAQLLNDLGVTLMALDRAADSERALREALAIRRQETGPQSLEVAQTLQNLAHLLRQRGNYTEAESAIRECLAIRRDRIGHEDQAIAEALQILATVLRRQGRLDDAEKTFLDAIAMQTRLVTAEHPTVADMTEDLGLLLDDQGRHAEAEQQLRQALEKRRRLQGDTHKDTLTCMVMLINNLLAAERYGDAEPLARECLNTRERLMPDHVRTFNARSVLGGCLLGLKRYEEAEPLLLSGYTGLKHNEGAIPREGRYVLDESVRRIIQLYEATQRPELAAEWKKRLVPAARE